MNLPYTEIFRVEVDSITNWDRWREMCIIEYKDEDGNYMRFEF